MPKSSPAASRARPHERDVMSGNDPIETAKTVASDAGEQLKITIQDQKQAGAHHVARFAQAVESAADQLDRDTPELARYVREAAHQVEAFSQNLRERDVRQLLGDVQDFARQQPTAFLGASMLVGFGLARFFKSAGPGLMAGDSEAKRQPREDGAGAEGFPV
jgi:hypothetical protein